MARYVDIDRPIKVRIWDDFYNVWTEHETTVAELLRDNVNDIIIEEPFEGGEE